MFEVASSAGDAAVITNRMKMKGLRITPQRFAVYANLLARSDHPTVEQILLDLNQDLPMSSRATIYSTLKALQSAGLVREVLLQEGICRYDAHVEPHHHFRCRHCGAIEDIAWSIFQPPALSHLRQGLQVEAYEATLSGLCDRCATQT